MKRLLIIILIFILKVNFIQAEENSGKNNPQPDIPVKKEKVVIFYFQDKSRTDKFRYLSSIIPESIAKDIRRIGDYEAETYPVNIDYLHSSASGEDKEAFTYLLMNMDKEVKADFMLVGSYYVDGNRIVISTQFFDVERKQIIYVRETESKISAIVLEMIEEATNRINTALNKAVRIKKEAKAKAAAAAAAAAEEERKSKISPFLGFYNTISGITFGINYGLVNYYGDSGDMYKNADHVSLNIFYELSNISPGIPFAVSGKFDYFATRTKESYNKDDNRNREFEFTGGSLNAVYLFKFTPNFNIAASVGVGIADVEIIKEEERDEYEVVISPAATIEDSLNPYYNFTLSMNFYIGNLKIESGCSYNIIHISDMIHYSVIYFGLGYRI
ncbi:MAG: hypothetical protein JXN64_14350 [Spirochaetes bacterium]|nr:hypothetical protein [Spirochaetota bacterium]